MRRFHCIHDADATDRARRGGIPQILSTAKMCVQLACHANCVEPLFRHADFKAIWLKLAQHQSPEVRQRAAAVFSKVASLNIGYAACTLGSCVRGR